ncbi:MAG: hypothetical protein LZF86_110109 [Nitrospira sp.]|nr:MAG: hypothetical protein LZF86_110109 [Nitrospira sp.]
MNLSQFRTLMVWEWSFMFIPVHKAEISHRKSASLLTIITMLSRHSMCRHLCPGNL